MQSRSAVTRIYCPEPVADRIERFIAGGLEIDACTGNFELRGLEPGERVELGRDFDVEAFATEHPVPSLGYHLWRRRTRLAAEYEGLEETEIARLRRSGVEVTAASRELLVSYCGDTGPAVFRRDTRLFGATLLMVEATYIDDGLRDRGREFGHMHLEDLAAVADRFDNRAIVLHHLSRRHRLEELRRAVDERLPEIAERVHVWGLDGAPARGASR